MMPDSIDQQALKAMGTRSRAQTFADSQQSRPKATMIMTAAVPARGERPNPMS